MNLELFPELHRELISLLRSLRRDDWLRPTACRGWTVKDIAGHILDGELRRLSLARDTYIPPGAAVTTYEGTVCLINRLNADWVTAAKRLSPGVVIDLLEWTAPQVWTYFSSLDPDGPAAFAVAWAGESESLNDFDIAREFTEQWHHQQQIRDAVKAFPLTAARWLRPVLETLIRALPHAYRNTAAAEGAAINFVIDGPAGGAWRVQHNGHRWKLLDQEAVGVLATVRMTDDAAWRLFTKGMDLGTARRNARIEGDVELGAIALGTVAVMG